MFAHGTSPFVKRGTTYGDWGNGWLKTLDTLIDMDFANGRYFGAKVTDLVTSRAASALAPAASGVYQTFASNVPRILSGKGLLPEEARTNGIRNSSGAGAVAGTPGTLPTNWSISTLAGITVAVGPSVVEAGLDCFDLTFSGTATGAISLFFEGASGSIIPSSNSQTWAASCFLKLQAGSLANTNIELQIAEWTAGGSYLSSGGGGFLSISSTLGRYAFSRTNNGGGTVGAVNSLLRYNFSGPVNFTIRVSAPQLELGAFATSPILTTSSALTRPADVIYLPVSGIGTEYTVYHETPVLASHVAQGSLMEMWASSNDRARVANVDQWSQAITLVSGGSPRFGLSLLIAGSGLARKSAMCIASGRIRLSVNGSLSAVDTGAIPVSAPTRAYFGAGNAGAGSFLNDNLRRIVIIPRAMSDAELQAITT